MSTGSNIEWTEATWNPVAGCTRVSAGCDHCYAVTMTHRLEKMSEGRQTKDGKQWKSNKEVALHQKYAGLTVLNNHGDRHFNGQVRCVEEALEVPLKWKKPRRIFVNSMSDLFHRDVPFEFIDRVFAVMALCPQHTFQVLTKRPERMAEYLATWPMDSSQPDRITDIAHTLGHPAIGGLCERPLPHVWLGTSCEDQAAADARIPHLLKCPAAVRFISAEPLLGEVSLVNSGAFFPGACGCQEEEGRTPCAACRDTGAVSGVDWVIVGGESGKGARPCNVEWIRSIVRQCREAGVACFVKQLGKRPYFSAGREKVSRDVQTPRGGVIHMQAGSILISSNWKLDDPKGGDPAEWPEDLRVREWPSRAGATV